MFIEWALIISQVLWHALGQCVSSKAGFSLFPPLLLFMCFHSGLHSVGLERAAHTHIPFFGLVNCLWRGKTAGLREMNSIQFQAPLQHSLVMGLGNRFASHFDLCKWTQPTSASLRHGVRKAVVRTSKCAGSSLFPLNVPSSPFCVGPWNCETDFWALARWFLRISWRIPRDSLIKNTTSSSQFWRSAKFEDH